MAHNRNGERLPRWRSQIARNPTERMGFRAHKSQLEIKKHYTQEETYSTCSPDYLMTCWNWPHTWWKQSILEYLYLVSLQNVSFMRQLSLSHTHTTRGVVKRNQSRIAPLLPAMFPIKFKKYSQGNGNGNFLKLIEQKLCGNGNSSSGALWINSPESQTGNSAGPRSRHWKLHFPEISSDQGTDQSNNLFNIYICCRVKTRSKNSLYLSQSWSKSFFSLFLYFIAFCGYVLNTNSVNWCNVFPPNWRDVKNEVFKKKNVFLFCPSYVADREIDKYIENGKRQKKP